MNDPNTKSTSAPAPGSELYGMVVAIQQDNCSDMVKDPTGPYPSCKPALGGRLCMRCGRDVIGRFDACPAVPIDQRWRFRSPNTQASDGRKEER